jgi:hypothetical protein
MPPPIVMRPAVHSRIDLTKIGFFFVLAAPFLAWLAQ